MTNKNKPKKGFLNLGIILSLTFLIVMVVSSPIYKKGADTNNATDKIAIKNLYSDTSSGNHIILKSMIPTSVETIDGVAVDDFISSLDDNKLASLVDSKALPSTIKAKNVLEAIQNAPGYDDLTPHQKSLIKATDISLVGDDNAGNLEITIANHGENKVINLEGFQTTDGLVVNDFVSKLDANKLDGFFDKKVDPSTITSQNVLEAIKGLASYDDLSSTQKALIKATDISLTSTTIYGNLKITIANHGESKIITLMGFQTVRDTILSFFTDEIEDTDDEVVNNFVSSLSAKKLASFVNSRALPSTITSQNVLEAIQGLAGYIALSPTQKALLKASDISLTSDDATGNLVITIANHGEDKVINLQDFQTIDIKAINDFISSLNANELAGFANSRALPSTITSQNVLEAIQGLARYIALSPTQKTLFKVSDISLTSDDATGNLVITIANHGENKVINLSKFQTTDIKVVNNFISSLNANKLASLVDSKSLPSTITSQNALEAIQGLAGYIALSPTQKALLKARDISLTSDDANGSLQITIANHGENKVINLKGFQTISQVGKKTLLDAILFLDANDLNHLANKNALPSSLSLKNIFDAIQNLDSIKKLTNNQKKLLVPNDINLVLNDNKGTLEVIVKKYGLDKRFKISEFLSSRKKSLKNNKDNLPIAQTIGIIVGSVVAFAIFGYLIYHFAIKRKKLKK